MYVRVLVCPYMGMWVLPTPVPVSFLVLELIKDQCQTLIKFNKLQVIFKKRATDAEPKIWRSQAFDAASLSSEYGGNLLVT